MILNFSLGRGIEYLNEVRQVHLESERPLIGGWDVVSHTCSPCPQGPEKVIRHILFEEDYYGAYTQRGLLRGSTQMQPGSHSFQLLPHKEPAIKGSWQRIRQGMRLTLHASQRPHTLTLIRHDRIP